MRARIMTQCTSSPSPASAQVPHSAWHSPIPFLFGGLGAMLALIIFALLVLACSYLKLSDYAESSEQEAQEAEEKQSKTGAKPVTSFVQQFVVIMAGDKNPVFLATPVASHAGCANKGECMEEKDGSASRHGGVMTEDQKNKNGRENQQEPDPAQVL